MNAVPSPAQSPALAPLGRGTWLRASTPVAAATKIAAGYALLAILWIGVSDQLALELAGSLEALGRLQRYKGATWVLLSAALVFGLSRLLVTRIVDSSRTAHRVEERLRAFMAAAPVTLFEATADGTTEFLSIDRTVLGFDVERLSGHRWMDTILPDDLPGYLARWQAFTAAPPGIGPDLFEQRVRVMREAGGIRWAMVRVRRTSDPGLFVGAAIDITPWKEAEVTLETTRLNAKAVDHARRQFLTNIGHELRTPLNAIIGFGDLLRGGAPLAPEAVRDYAGDIRQAGQRLLEVLDDMLTCAQVEATALSRTPEAMDLDAEVTRAFRRVVSRFHSKYQDWTYAPAPGAVAIVDVPGFRQVLHILLDNAGRYTPNGGRIDVEVVDRAGMIEVTVENSGPGFPSEVLEQAGAPFLRGGDALRSDEAGLGLGLYLALKLARLMGGHLHLSNRAGRGASAVLLVPSLPTPDVNTRSLPMNRSRAALNAFRANPSDIEQVFRAACQDIVETVGSTRASIWFFNLLGDEIACECLYDQRTGTFSSGAVLTEEDFPGYFAAIRRDLRVEAGDAANHPATACFDEPYFIPNDIRSLLDHVVVAGKQPVAVLCCEHCGDKRAWTKEDETYLHQMAVLLGMAFKARIGAMTAA